MINPFLVAGAAAASLLIAFATIPSASAVPLAPSGIEKSTDVTLVRRGGGGGGHGMRGGGGFRGGAVHGGGMRGFRGGGRPHIGRHGGGGPRVHHRGHHGHRHGHHRHRGVRFYPRFYGYAPYYYYGSDYFLDDDDGCEWLRLRALKTNSRYWWSRYRRCMGY